MSTAAATITVHYSESLLDSEVLPLLETVNSSFTQMVQEQDDVFTLEWDRTVGRSDADPKAQYSLLITPALAPSIAHNTINFRTLFTHAELNSLDTVEYRLHRAIAGLYHMMAKAHLRNVNR